MRPQNQTLLALIMAFVMSLGFIGVYAVSYQYETTAQTEQVYSSDSDLEFLDWDTTLRYPEIPQPYGIGGYMINAGVYEKTNTTPVFLGNDTWGASLIGFDPHSPHYSNAYYYIPILITQAKTFITDTINITCTLAGEPVTVDIYIGGVNNPDDNTNIPAVRLDQFTTTTETSFTKSFDLSSYEKLQWYSTSQQINSPTLTIVMYDTGFDGLSTYAMELKVIITGETTTTWSLQDSVNLVIGISIAGNIIVMAYMTDSLDFGGSRKDLPGKKGWSPKRKSGKRR